MGLYMNTGEHPEVFLNDGNITEPNQGYFKYDFFKEWMTEQQQVNESLDSAYQGLEKMYRRQAHKQASNWKEIDGRLRDLQEQHQHHEQFETRAMEWLTMLDKSNDRLQHLLENEQVLNQEVKDEIALLNQSNQEIANQLGNYELSNKELALQLNELTNLQKQMADQVAKQDTNQHDVLTQLENQEAMLEKTSRQITQFRSALFERTNFLAEKIENSYNLTSSYVYKLLTGSDQPLTLLIRNQRTEEKQKHSD